MENHKYPQSCKYFKRGFSITYLNGKSIKKVSQLVEGDQINTCYIMAQ
jgi:hypothetical protein